MGLLRCVLLLSPTSSFSGAPSGGLCWDEDVPGEEDGEGEGESETPEQKRVKGLETAAAEERRKRQEAEKRLKEIEDAEKERQRKADEEKGEHKKLYATEKERADRLEAENATLKGAEKTRLESLEKSNQERLEALPEDLRELVPEGLSVDATAAQIAKLEKRAEVESEAPSGTFRKRAGKPPPIPDACHAAARSAGLAEATPAFFEKWKTATNAGKAWAAAQSKKS